jgi:hypothetical protein
MYPSPSHKSKTQSQSMPGNIISKSKFSSLQKTRWKGSKIFPLQGEFGDLTDALGEPGCYRDTKKMSPFS